jgi:glycosyltransferase involved in cell wall biosynthesis
MPVFNAETYLQESIKSILKQTFRDFEFIIINDGSTDGSLPIIRKYEKTDRRIKVISRQNKGVVYTLNEGLQIAKGTYIARMDADDIAYSHRLEMQYKYLKNNNDIDLIGSQIDVFGDVDKDSMEEIKNRYGQYIPQSRKECTMLFLRENVLCHPSIMGRRTFFVRMGGYRNLYPTSEDYDLWIRSIKNGANFQNLNETLIKYRIHQKSVTRKNVKNSKIILDRINIKLDFIESRLTNKNLRYVVWGAGNGGMMTQKIIERRFKRCKFEGYIDSYKEGEQIYKPSEIDQLNFDYIFIATSPGKRRVETFLLRKGLKPLDDFLWTV